MGEETACECYRRTEVLQWMTENKQRMPYSFDPDTYLSHTAKQTSVSTIMYVFDKLSIKLAIVLDRVYFIRICKSISFHHFNKRIK
jgi:hypothetical protein